MRMRKTKSVNLRVPLDVYAKVEAEVERLGPPASCYGVMLDLIAKIGESSAPKPPGPHEYPIPLKSHIQGQIVADKYGNAYELVGDNFVYKDFTR